MWSPPGITEPTLIRRYGLMMSDLRGLITQSTSVTFQHIITPVLPPPFSLQQPYLTKGSDFKSYTFALPLLWVNMGRTEKHCAEVVLYYPPQVQRQAWPPRMICDFVLSEMFLGKIHNMNHKHWCKWETEPRDDSKHLLHLAVTH